MGPPHNDPISSRAAQTRARPVHANPARQAVPSESPFCHGMVFAVRDYGLLVKIILTCKGSNPYKPAFMASYKHIGFTVGAPSSRVWSIPAGVHRGLLNWD